MSKLPPNYILRSSDIPTTLPDMATLQLLLLEKVFAPAALRLLQAEPDAVAAVALCDLHYNDEGYTHQASMLPAYSLPDPLGSRSVCDHLYETVEGVDAGDEEDEDDVDERWYEMLLAHRLSVPDGIVSVMVGAVVREKWHAVAVFLRGDSPQEIVLQPLPLGR